MHLAEKVPAPASTWWGKSILAPVIAWKAAQEVLGNRLMKHSVNCTPRLKQPLFSFQQAFLLCLILALPCSILSPHLPPLLPPPPLALCFYASSSSLSFPFMAGVTLCCLCVCIHSKLAAPLHQRKTTCFGSSAKDGQKDPELVPKGDSAKIPSCLFSVRIRKGRMDGLLFCFVF